MAATNYKEMYTSSSPPAFGHPMLKLFGFDPDYVNLNHGSWGSLPLPVLAECDKLARRIESNPDKFMRIDLEPMLEDARVKISEFLHAEPDEVVLVPNASHGLNTVLRNFEFNEGDIIVTTSTTYNSISSTAEYIRDSPPHPTISTFPLQFPITHADVVSRFREHLLSLTAEDHVSPEEHRTLHASSNNRDMPKRRKIIAVIDSIISAPAAYLPWKEMVNICAELGVWSVIDAAHSIGQEPGINLSGAKPDFWISNAHKWFFAKRGSAILYVPRRNQYLIRSSFPTPPTYKTNPQPVVPQSHPNQDSATSSSHNTYFTALFDWTGTMDHIPMFSILSAMEFRKWLGGEEKINAYCHDLAIRGGQRLAEILGAQPVGILEEIALNMVNVPIPIPSHLTQTYLKKMYDFIMRELIQKWNTFGAIYYHEQTWYVRCSAQIWNEISDFEYIGKALLAVCEQIPEKISPSGV